MSNKKQSSVDWLVDELTTLGYITFHHSGHAIIDKAIDQAKKMEKEQIVEIVEKSRETGLTAEYLILSLYGGENE